MKFSHRSCSQHSNSAYNFVCSNAEVCIGPHRRASFMWRFAHVCRSRTCRRRIGELLFFLFSKFNVFSHLLCIPSTEWLGSLFTKPIQKWPGTNSENAALHRPFNWKTVNQLIFWNFRNGMNIEWRPWNTGSAYSIRIEHSYWSMRSVFVSRQ